MYCLQLLSHYSGKVELLQQRLSVPQSKVFTVLSGPLGKSLPTVYLSHCSLLFFSLLVAEFNAYVISGLIHRLFVLKEPRDSMMWKLLANLVRETIWLSEACTDQSLVHH